VGHFLKHSVDLWGKEKVTTAPAIIIIIIIIFKTLGIKDPDGFGKK